MEGKVWANGWNIVNYIEKLCPHLSGELADSILVKWTNQSENGCMHVTDVLNTKYIGDFITFRRVIALFWILCLLRDRRIRTTKVSSDGIRIN